MADMVPIKAVYNLGNSVGLSEFAATDTLPASRVSGLGTAATKNIPATGNASATEVVYGTDSRLTDARTPTSHATTGHSDWPAAVSMTEVGYLDGVTSAIQTQLGDKAPLDSPALTGTPTAPTAAAGTNSTQIATTAHVYAERSNTAILTNKTLTSPTVSGGTINNATIGATTATTGKFTTITASTGILFGTDTAAANTLDDYEEGTWSVNINFYSGQIGSFTFVDNTGKYTKIGNVVTVSCFLSWIDKPTSGTSGAYFSLPIAPTGNNIYRGAGIIGYYNGTWTSPPTMLRVEYVTTQLGLFNNTNYSDFPSNGGLIFSCTYLTD